MSPRSSRLIPKYFSDEATTFLRGMEIVGFNWCFALLRAAGKRFTDPCVTIL